MSCDAVRMASGLKSFSFSSSCCRLGLRHIIGCAELDGAEESWEGTAGSHMKFSLPLFSHWALYKYWITWGRGLLVGAWWQREDFSELSSGFQPKIWVAWQIVSSCVYWLQEMGLLSGKLLCCALVPPVFWGGGMGGDLVHLIWFIRWSPSRFAWEYEGMGSVSFVSFLEQFWVNQQAVLHVQVRCCPCTVNGAGTNPAILLTVWRLVRVYGYIYGFRWKMIFCY